MFLNEEKKKLMDCTDAEIATIVRATRTGEAQRYYGDLYHPDYPGGWIEGAIVHSVSATGVYRVKPRPMTINWDHVGQGWNHLRADKDEELTFYAQPPDLKGSFWASSGEMAEGVDIRLLASFERGDLPWYEAICDRPGFETNN